MKVYVRHHDSTADDLEAACSGAESYTPGEVHEFVRAMGGDRERLTPRATFTCSALVEGSVRPAATTVYVPICAYAPDDLVASQRVHDYLEEHGMDPAPYDALVRGYAERPLDAGVGMQSWVAFRRHHDDPRLTVYLATEAGMVHPRGSVPAATGDRLAFASAEAVVRTASDYDLTDHPLVQRTSREHATALLPQLVRAAYEALEKDRGRWVASVVARVADDRIRAVLARELGNLTQSRSDAVLALLAALGPEGDGGDHTTIVENARASAARISAHCSARDGLEGIGALLGVGICTRQLFGAIAEVLAHTGAGPEIVALAKLAADTDGALEITRLVPATRDSLAAIGRGTTGAHAAAWKTLDDVYVANCG